MTTRRITLAAALCLAAFAAIAVDSSEITREKYPDADAVVVDSLDDIVYNPDGTSTTHSKTIVKILTEKGRREESEVTMRYSARYMRSSIDSVSIRRPDGTVRKVDVAATTKESTDNSSASENIYDPMFRKIVCTVPGVEIGDEIIYETTSSCFASRIQDQWADAAVLEWVCPLVNFAIRIKSPAERPLKTIALRNPLGNITYDEQSLEDGSIVRTWTAKDSPQMFPEPDMPPKHTQVQRLLVSTASDWKEISRWYWSVCLPHLEKTNEAITNKVAEIAATLPSMEGGQSQEAALLTAIYKWVAQEIRYMGLTMEDASPGYAPHDVEITFENRYGVCRDKAALLAAMLRIAGFDAFPVLIHAGAKMDPEVPTPYFNHAIVAVDDGNGDYILMDPTDESSRDLLPAYLSDRSYLVARPDGEGLRTSPVPGAELNAVRVRSDGVLDKSGSMLLESRIDLSGINDNLYRRHLLRLKNEARRKFFERMLINVAPGAELLDIEVSPSDLQDTAQPLSFRLVARMPQLLLEGETRTEFNPPMLSRSLGVANWLLSGKTSLESRKYPLVIDSTAMVDETFRVRLNGVLGDPLLLPAAVKIDGDYSYEKSYAFDGDELTIRRRSAVNAVEFTPAAYQEIREGIKAMEAAERERAVFAKRRLSGANARVFYDREFVNVLSPRDWVVTNTVSQQILSYDGKKKLSEMKFEYNPAWKTIEVVSAVVSNADGKVSVATDREMNEFDCGWVASAPRYPASKQLIVNLPGVEVGSFITYTIATTVHDSPVEFYGQWGFDSYEPTDEISLTLNGETRTVRNAKVIPTEPLTAMGDLWRDRKIVSSNDFCIASRRLRKAAQVGKLKCDESGEKPWGASVKSIRDWMTKNVRVAGPSLYETPIEAQMTDPAVVVRERYASRFDYIRTLCAILRGAGFDADIVFASLDVDYPAEIRNRAMLDKPDVGAFAFPLCRVRERRGGFLWFGGKTVTYYLGTENEFSPLGVTHYDGSHFLDPVKGEFGVVEAASPELHSFESGSTTIYVRDNGAVDIDVESTQYGPSVATFRQKYEEMLPEDRQRHYQELLGGIAQAASATSELETDTAGYPARMSFKAFVPDYAFVAGDAITIALPAFLEHLFPITGAKRENPIGIAAKNPDEEIVRVVFPEGYTKVEHLPAPYEFRNPADNAPWYNFTVSTAVEDGRLVVTLKRTCARREYAMLGANYAALIKDWSRIGSTRPNRTICVRKCSE